MLWHLDHMESFKMNFSLENDSGLARTVATLEIDLAEALPLREVGDLPIYH